MSMQTKNKSFFSTTAGLVTGMAGVITAVVGLLGISTQQGWIGSKGDSSPSTTATTLAPNLGGALLPTTAPAGGATGTGPAATTANAQFTVAPTVVDFEKLPTRETVVTVQNVGRNAITFDPPTITGLNARNFTANPVDASCTRLDAGRSCQIKVTFAPSGGGTYTATLVVKPVGAPAQEVRLSGRSLL